MEEVSEGKCPFGYGSEQADDGRVSKSRHMVAAAALHRDKLPTLVKEAIEVGTDGQVTGRCLCGGVSYRINKPVTKVFANHDAQSRRWTGGIALTIMIRATSMDFNGWGNIVNYPSSARENHCFCRLCGTSLFVRYAQPEAMDGMLSLSAGTLDTMDGMSLAAETYIDHKPDLYELAGERRTMTETEIEKMFVPTV